MDANDILRLKNSERLKGSNAIGFIKRLFNNKRYNEERRAAAAMFSSSSTSLTVQTGIKKIKGTMSTIDQIRELVKQKQQLVFERNKTEEALEINQEKIINSNRGLTEVESKGLRSFFTVYQTNKGAAALNAMARRVYCGSNESLLLSTRDVIKEYNKRLGLDIFSGKSGEAAKLSIENKCDELKKSLKEVTDQLYFEACIGRDDKKVHVYRGQGMTRRGSSAIELSEIYQVGQFFSTSSDLSVAKDFANQSADPVKVLFDITGYSGRVVVTLNGFRYDRKESEILFSPRACFRVEKISQENGLKIIQLMEVVRKSNKDVKILPY